MAAYKEGLPQHYTQEYHQVIRLLGGVIFKGDVLLAAFFSFFLPTGQAANSNVTLLNASSGSRQ